MQWSMTVDDPSTGQRTRVDRDVDGLLRVVIGARRDHRVLRYLVVQLVAASLGLAALVAFLVSASDDVEVAAYLTVGFALGWLFTAVALAWALLGREIVELSSDALTVTRAAGPYRRTRRCPRESVERLAAEPEPVADRLVFNPVARWRQIVVGAGLVGGSIALECGGETRRFGNTLDEAESRRVAAVLREELGLPN